MTPKSNLAVLAAGTITLALAWWSPVDAQQSRSQQSRWDLRPDTLPLEVLGDRFLTQLRTDRPFGELDPGEQAVSMVVRRLMSDPDDLRGDRLAERIWEELERDPDHPRLISLLGMVIRREHDVPHRMRATTLEGLQRLYQQQPRAVLLLVGSASEPLREAFLPIASERLLAARTHHDIEREVRLILGLGPVGHAEVDRLHREGQLSDHAWNWIRFVRGEWRPPGGGT